MSFSSGRESAHEDYLKTIYAFTEWQDDPITPSVLAGRLSLAPSTVTEMVKKLAAAGLVSHVRYGAISLTDSGRERALAVVRRHRIVETWLVREMGYTWDTVHDEAEVLEHAISDRLLEAINERMGHPTADPHGDLIPSIDGVVVRPDARIMAETPAETPGIIVRIRDRDPRVLRTLAEHDLGPGSSVTVVSGDPTPTLRHGETTITLPEGAAHMIWLTTPDHA